VIPDIPHLVPQRGNRRQELFTEPADCALYRDSLVERCDKNGVSCLGLLPADGECSAFASRCPTACTSFWRWRRAMGDATGQRPGPNPCGESR
jgi:hypothetical protein